MADKLIPTAGAVGALIVQMLFGVPAKPLTLRFFFYPKESGRIGLIKLYSSRLG